MRPLATLTTLLLTLPSLAYSAYCSGSPDPNAPSNSLPTTLNPAKTLVNSTDNGLVYKYNDDKFHSFLVTHLWGTPYEQGYAQGEMMGDEIDDFFQTTYEYLSKALAEELPQLRFPEWFLDLVVEKGLDWALDWTAEATAAYTDPKFFEELQGISDGSGVDYQLLLRIHMLPEATKGACSMIGASDTATETGNLLQLRALDWDVDGPFKDHANLIVYHNDDDPERVSWANIAWTGFIGSVTGFNEQKMSISEIGVTFPDDTFGKESRHGTPFVNLLRDVLEKESTFKGADDRISNADRTCNLILGVGDAKTSQFNAVQYSADVANFITSDNLQPVNDTWHAPITDITYFGMDWLCPGFSEVLHDQLVANAPLTPANMIEDVIAITQTGNLHIAVYDLAESSVYLSFAKKSDDDGSDGEGDMAFERTYTRIDADALFSTPAPTH
ncbi:hypothetical protein TrST_g10202 [Triparma strigata]|uniref:Uncharacterized protein n=1 Tax=Triparma strigata TaxID=1606541 RepID=A0A9W7A570_9STRA|nr:hypothetical protein TrST_g10202 [Triparma strigata]